LELFQRLVAPLVFKIGIHRGQAGRKGVRGGEEEGWSGGISFSISFKKIIQFRITILQFLQKINKNYVSTLKIVN
jgi:hypothetical protein